jgi:hypothetical protein
MFMHEKGITGIDSVPIDLNAGEHRAADYRAKVPVARVPALELDDGRVLSETRAICSYLEGLHPQPNLMGEGFDERAFIEMHDRRVEWYWLLPIAHCVRHTHPAWPRWSSRSFPIWPVAGRQGARVGALAGRRATKTELDGRRALHHRRHHRLLRHRVRAPDEVQRRRRGLCRAAGLARPGGRAAERARRLTARCCAPRALAQQCGMDQMRQPGETAHV